MKIIFKKIIAYILRVESQLVLWKYKPKVIAITGSVGKTSTKDAVYAVMAGVSYVRKSEKNYNSEIGLPLTILGIPNGWNNPLVWFKNILKGLWLFISPQKYPQWLVLEVGIGKPDDMRRTASWLKTDVVIITAIGEMPSHIEFFNSRKSLIEEKSSLIKTLKKDGLLILNADDEDVLLMKTKIKNCVTTFGFREGADILGSGDSIFYDDNGTPKGIIFRVDEGGLAHRSTAEGNSFPVVVEGVFGRNHVYAALASFALISGLKFNMVNAINALKNYSISPGRMRLLEGIEDCLIIDDTYNSSPFACEFALKTLKEIKFLPHQTGRKIAVLGDMLELGKHTIEAHKNIGKIAEENLSGKEDALIVVGPRAKAIKEGALLAGMNQENVFEFLNSSEAAKFIKTFAQKGDFILVKGSQGMRMERIVEAILLDQKNKNKLLVRQDDAWQKKK
jgi:UDP-N-acetylmuramoyl-tripeptide--D-alanyl-D-alanine ligase